MRIMMFCVFAIASSSSKLRHTYHLSGREKIIIDFSFTHKQQCVLPYWWRRKRRVRCWNWHCQPEYGKLIFVNDSDSLILSCWAHYLLPWKSLKIRFAKVLLINNIALLNKSLDDLREYNFCWWIKVWVGLSHYRLKVSVILEELIESKRKFFLAFIVRNNESIARLYTCEYISFLQASFHF